jgi:hypothetical protein
MLRVADDECAGGHAPRTMGGADESPGVSGRTPLASQVAGNHYAKLAIQPVEYILRNNLDYFAGNVIKYITRHKSKGGAEDIRKAIHYCQLILELQYNKKD